jgi:hypothetical protein
MQQKTNIVISQIIYRCMMPQTTYEPTSSGKCPHCQEIVTFGYPFAPSGWSARLQTGSGGDTVFIYSSCCPNKKCKKPIVVAKITRDKKEQIRLVHPFNVVRTVPPEVPQDIKEDFLEASAVLVVSEKASAALSRRCLQNLLTQQGYKKRDLFKQIDAALKDLPTRIAENLDVVRVIGNYATHPIKYKSTGLVVDVEPEEASWTLDVLEDLFEYYYVQPKRAAEKRKKLEAKLKGSGKPPLKKP